MGHGGFPAAASGLPAAPWCSGLQVRTYVTPGCLPAPSQNTSSNFSKLPRTRKSRPPNVVNWMKDDGPAHASLSLVCALVNQSVIPSSAVRRQVKLALRGEKGHRGNLVRLTFLGRFTLLDERLLQRVLLTPVAATFQHEEPQVSTEKARSYHHSKLLAVVVFFPDATPLVEFCQCSPSRTGGLRL